MSTPAALPLSRPAETPPTPSTPPAPTPAAPVFVHMARIVCPVAPLVSLGGPAKHGERRYVPLLGGDVTGPELQGTLEPGGMDWQIQRADGVTEISAHYVIRMPDGALVEVQSDGLRHGPADTMQRLARGEAVPPGDYFFRTWVRLTTGHAAWLHLNKVMALAVGQREASRVLLDLWRLT